MFFFYAIYSKTNASCFNILCCFYFLGQQEIEDFMKSCSAADISMVDWKMIKVKIFNEKQTFLKKVGKLQK